MKKQYCDKCHVPLENKTSCYTGESCQSCPNCGIEYRQSELCSCGNMVGIQCPQPVKWINQNGVKVCDHGKLLLDAFTWENRNNRKWQEVK